MPTPFSRTLRSVQTEGFRDTLGVLFTLGVLLAAWVLWFVHGEVTLCEVAESARLEVGQSVAPIAARVGGLVVSSRMTLGREVEAGEVLVELDAETEQLELLEGQARRKELAAQIDPLRREIAVREDALHQSQRAGQARIAEARIRQEEARMLATFSKGEANRAERLRGDGLVSAQDVERSAFDAQMKRVAVDTLRIGIDRIDAEQRKDLSDSTAEPARLRRELAKLEAQQATESATIARLEREIKLRRICAPVRGRIGEAVSLQAGAVIRDGERLGSVVPVGDLRIVAEFKAASIGRLEVGQPARLRLDGFPSIQYGTLPAVVSGVGSEPREGHVRVELHVKPGSPSPIPFQHGLPGIVEVDIETVSPVVLLLRTVGQFTLRDRPVGP